MPPPERERALVPVLLGLTVVTGLVDAASILGLGRVFTANMTGNVVFLGFAAAGAPGHSFVRSSAALLAFLLGAVAGGRIGLPLSAGGASRPVSMALGCEAALLLAATGVALGYGADLIQFPLRLYSAIVLTGVAMGIRNAVVRKLAIPDLTTTVLTMTLTGLAADAAIFGGPGKGSARRLSAIVAMLVGAICGALMLRAGVALPMAFATGLALVTCVAYPATQRGAS